MNCNGKLASSVKRTSRKVRDNRKNAIEIQNTYASEVVNGAYRVNFYSAHGTPKGELDFQNYKAS